MIYVDTNILVDMLRGYSPSQAWLTGLAEEVFCSRVSEVELLTGAGSLANRKPVDKLLQTFTIVTPSEQDFEFAVELFRKYFLSHGIDYFDCLIAATAVRLQTPVYTHNTKHLGAIKEVQVLRAYN